MKVLITGGTGFVGRELCELLVGRGDDVVVLTRGASRASGRVRFVAFDGPWQRELDDSDAVVNLAGAPIFEGRWTERRREELVSSRVGLTRTLAAALGQAASRKRVLVSGSAVGYYGMREGDRLLDERSPAGDDFLAGLCVAWEAAAREAEAPRTRVAIARVGIVLGRGGGALSKMVPAFRAFVGGPLGSGHQYMSWIHLRDAARALLFAVDRESLTGPFNVTAPAPATMNDLSAELARALRRPSLFRVPGAALRLALGQSADALLTGQRALPRALADSGFSFVFPDLGSALADATRQAA